MKKRQKRTEKNPPNAFVLAEFRQDRGHSFCAQGQNQRIAKKRCGQLLGVGIRSGRREKTPQGVSTIASLHSSLNKICSEKRKLTEQLATFSGCHLESYMMWDPRQIEKAIRCSLKSLGIDVPANWQNLKTLVLSKKDEVLNKFETEGDGDILKFAVAMLTSDAMDVLPTGIVTGLPGKAIEPHNGVPISTYEGVQEAANRLKNDLIAKWVDRHREHNGEYPPSSELDRAELLANACVDTCCPDEHQVHLTRKGQALEKWYGEAIKRSEILLAVPPLPEDIQEQYLEHYKAAWKKLDDEIQSRALATRLHQESMMAVTRSRAKKSCEKLTTQSGGANDSLTSTEIGEDQRGNSSDSGQRQKRQKTMDESKARCSLTNEAVEEDDPGKEPYMADVELTFECESPAAAAAAADPSQPGPSYRRASWPTTQHADPPPDEDPGGVPPPINNETPENVQTPKRTKRLRKPLSRNIWSGGNMDKLELPINLGVLDDNDFGDSLGLESSAGAEPTSSPSKDPTPDRGAREEVEKSPGQLSWPWSSSSDQDPDPDLFFNDPEICAEEKEPEEETMGGQEEELDQEEGEGPFDRSEAFEPVPLNDKQIEKWSRFVEKKKLKKKN
ncbi:hypothetical protein BSKO_11466 [Bryopsis sp. KO-2023]|nr:hypothetical protein BSKO_11466 [Bryopsis sp. KO-2023]